MSDPRIVRIEMTAEQAEFFNELTVRLMREGEKRALWVGNLAIAYKWSPPLAPPLPDNVVAFPGHSVRV